MRDLFPGYYRPTRTELERFWREGLFVPDANVLLNLYRYSDRTREVLLTIFRSLGERLWVAHQTAKEFQENRLSQIASQKSAYDGLREAIEDVNKLLGQQVEAARRHPVIDSSALEAEATDIRERLRAFLESARKEDPKLFNSVTDLIKDPIRASLDELLGSRVGAGMTAEELHRLYEEGRDRYEKEIPPGFRDRDKGEPRMYGDLVFWKQVLRKATETGLDVTIITDERKDDWWWRDKGKRLGPRPELVEELMKTAGTRLQIYGATRFMREADGRLNSAVSKDAIDEVERLGRRWTSYPSERDAPRPGEVWDASPPEFFTRDEVMEFTGVTERQLDYWSHLGLVEPRGFQVHSDGRRQPLYLATDLRDLTAIRSRLAAGFPLALIHDDLQRQRRADRSPGSPHESEWAESGESSSLESRADQSGDLQWGDDDAQY